MLAASQTVPTCRHGAFERATADNSPEDIDITAYCSVYTTQSAADAVRVSRGVSKYLYTRQSFPHTMQQEPSKGGNAPEPAFFVLRIARCGMH